MEITLEHVLMLLLFVFLVRFIMCNCGCNRVVEGLPALGTSISNLINIFEDSVELNADNIVNKFKDILSGNDADQKKLLSAMIDDLGTFCASGITNDNCSNLIDQLPGLFSKAINVFFDPVLNNQKTWSDWGKTNLLITVAVNIVYAYDAYDANAGKLCKNTGDCNYVMDNLKTQLLGVIENNITNVVRYCQFVPSRCKPFFYKKFPNRDAYRGDGTTSKPKLATEVVLARAGADITETSNYENYTGPMKSGSYPYFGKDFRCNQEDLHGVTHGATTSLDGYGGEKCGHDHYCMGAVGDGDNNCYCMSIPLSEASSGFYMLTHQDTSGNLTENYSVLHVMQCAESDK